MGFWKGVAGAVTGFAAGGPLGAVAGGAAGLASGGDSASQSQSSTSSRRVDLSAMSPQERALYDQGVTGVLGQDLSPEAAEELHGRTYENIYGLQEENINRSAEQATSRAYVSGARRGAAGGSSGKDRQILREGETQRALGEASRTASLSADEAVLRESANRRANAASYMDRINSIWSNQLNRSTITTSGSGTQTYDAKDTFWEDAAGGLGQAVASRDSWLNEFFSKKPGVGTSASPGKPGGVSGSRELAILGPQQSRQAS